MGCAISKDVKNPSNGTSSAGKLVHKGLTIQVDQSIKNSDGRYVAAIFSANCDIVRNHASVKALEMRKYLPKLSGKGSYPQHKASAAPERTHGHVSEKSSGDTVLGIPILSTDEESRVPTTQKTIDLTNEDLETVNILELMEGLAEAEVSANFEQWHVSHDQPSMPSTQAAETSDMSTNDLGTRLPRPMASSSFKSIKDVDCTLSARSSKLPPPIRCASEHEKMYSKECFYSPDALSQKRTSLSHTNVAVGGLRYKTNSTAADTVASHHDGKAFRNTDSLQRALSFKYMLNDNSSKKLDCLISDLNPAASQFNEGSARLHHGQRLVVATRRLWDEGEGPSTPLSSEFSPAISLKDWLPSTNHPSNGSYLEGGAEPSILDPFQPFQSYAPAFPLSTDRTKAETMYPQGVSSQSPSLGGTIYTSARVEEEDGVPVFDPEMLDSFENAMKNLSKEEWDAVRGMEDSPRNFLRLVKALKKSSSNSMRNQKALDTMDQLEAAEPLDMKLRRLSAEKKLAFMRQNSLEVKKALARQLSMKQGRANVVFYSSTTQTSAKMYEDCNQVRSILQSLVGVSYDERSISELLEHEQELSYALNISAVIVPTIYVKGKYLVGVDSIMQLYEKGLLNSMLQDAVSFGSKTSMQCICRGGKFLSCPFCNGRRKLSRVGEGTLVCMYCSGSGLIKCISCSST